MAIQAVFIVFISSLLALSASQFCGSVTECTQQYNASCPLDTSADEYDNCLTTQSSCNQPIGPTDNLSVDCYDTCIIGVPATSMQCCANSVSAPETISLTIDPGFLIARLFSPNSPGAYPSNRFCKYNVQCPNENFNLHYTLVRFNIEPSVNGQCLDFLRYEFTGTGTSVPEDACGDLNSLPEMLRSGPHFSSLMVNFRSNRINTGMDFFLAITCTLPPESAANGQNSNDPSVAPFLAAGPRSQERTKCTRTRSLSRVVGTDPSRIISARQYLNRVFKVPKGKFSSRIYRTVTVTRAGVVLYKDNTITVVHKGKVRYRFRNIKVLQVQNRIEGYLKFYGNASPRGRTFPGYGFLQVRRGIVQYVQTILDPRFLLNAEEESIVRQLYQEHFFRERLGTKGGVNCNSGHLRPGKDQRVNCSINRLAKLNVQSCTAVVRVVATFFLKSDTFQEYCNSKGY